MKFFFLLLAFSVAIKSYSQCFLDGIAYNVGTTITDKGVKKKCKCIIDVPVGQPCNARWEIVQPTPPVKQQPPVQQPPVQVPPVQQPVQRQNQQSAVPASSVQTVTIIQYMGLRAETDSKGNISKKQGIRFFPTATFENPYHKPTHFAIEVVYSQRVQSGYTHTYTKQFAFRCEDSPCVTSNFSMFISYDEIPSLQTGKVYATARCTLYENDLRVITSNQIDLTFDVSRTQFGAR